MADRVMFTDAEERVCNHLRPLLATTVVSVVPKVRPTTFVTVQRVGGVDRNLVVDGPTLAVDCWAGAKHLAHDLAQQAWAELRALAGGAWVDGVWCYRCDTVGGPGWSPDPDSGQPRFTFSVSLALRGS